MADEPAEGTAPCTFSLIVSTLGRGSDIVRLFESLERQSCPSFEVIVVDQNDDDRVGAALAGRDWPFPVSRIRTPGERGLSRGRNVGWRRSKGAIVGFPDDDCWYPPTLLADVQRLMGSGGPDILCGRAADETGRSINGRFETRPQNVTRRNVWTTQIEWMVFFKRASLESVGGYDEGLGVGAPTPWQAAEGQDILLRALDAGLVCRYDPALYGHHAELNVETPDAAMRRKGRMYARGMGFVLRKHGFGPEIAAYWAMRAVANLVRSALSGYGRRTSYYAQVALGRLEGWAGRGTPL